MVGEKGNKLSSFVQHFIVPLPEIYVQKTTRKNLIGTSFIQNIIWKVDIIDIFFHNAKDMGYNYKTQFVECF